jgi:hypothetical protein
MRWSRCLPIELNSSPNGSYSPHYYLWELRWEAQQSIGALLPRTFYNAGRSLIYVVACIASEWDTGDAQIRRQKAPRPFGYSRAMERKNRKRRNVDNAHGLRPTQPFT